MRRLIAVSAAALALAVAPVPVAAATPPQSVTITIDETFNAEYPFVTGDITAIGGVFGTGASGELQSVAFKPVGWSPSPDHLFVYTATDQYTFEGGTFLINFEASCTVMGFDAVENEVTLACAGNWRVNGGTGEYGRLKGTGTFTETQELIEGVGTGFITLVGKMHLD